MLDFSEIKMGKVIEFNNQPCVVLKADLLKMNRAKPTKKVKMRNLVTGGTLEYNFKSGESVTEADLRKDKASFMYKNGSELSFMLSESFETIEVLVEMMEGKEGYLKEGLDVVVVYFNDDVISVELPVKISFKVVNTTDVAKGNSVSDIQKDAEIETGLVVKVPGFIKVGESVIINTDTDEYVERDTSK